MKVAKFGGSSVASAKQIKKVGSIIQSDSKRRVIVVSAPGKRENNDIKMTDLLITLGDAVVQNREWETIFLKISERYKLIIEELNISDELLNKINNNMLHLVKNYKSFQFRFMDYIKASGEDHCAMIVAEYLKNLNIDAEYLNPKDAGLWVSDEPGNAQVLPKTFEQLKLLRNERTVYVIPGFFGYTVEGDLVTFPRGGSDITGSIVAAGVQADLYENFTDVDSVFSANPKIVHKPKEISELTYREMRELSYAGFSVFHDEALIPAFKAGIQVCIKNTNNPSAKGTYIVSNRETSKSPVVGIASDSGFCSIYVSKYLMNREIGFGRKVLQILEDEGISFEHTPSGIDDLSIIVREQQLTKNVEERIVKRINEELHVDTMKIDRNLAMIMIVGEGMHHTIGIASKATNAFAKANVNIEMINQGSSEVSMMFGVKAEDEAKAVEALYSEYFID